jgi:hypothetical protein
MELRRKAELFGLGGLILGLLFGWLTGTEHGQGSFVDQMRGELMDKCVERPDVLQEIDQKLINNDRGLITPEILRHVLKDVVNHC